MPNFTTPRAEGERMDMAEIMLEASKQRVEQKLLNNPILRCLKTAQFIENCANAAAWSAAQSIREDATFTDELVAERDQIRLNMILAWLDEQPLTEAGRSVWCMVRDDMANAKGLAS